MISLTTIIRKSHPSWKISLAFVVLGAIYFSVKDIAVNGIDGSYLSEHESVGRQVDVTRLAVPISFERNTGRYPGDVLFSSRGDVYSTFLTKDGAVIVLHGKASRVDKRRGETNTGDLYSGNQMAIDAVGLTWLGVNPDPVVDGLDPSPVYTLYGYEGGGDEYHEPGQQAYQKVRFYDIYAGVDLVYYGNQRLLEYDFIISPEANLSDIKMEVSGANNPQINSDGSLSLYAGMETVTLKAPRAYQLINGHRFDIDSGYLEYQQNVFGFQLGPYDKEYPLIIDPTIDQSTFLGGSDIDSMLSVAVDNSGNSYITGYTISADYPERYNYNAEYDKWCGVDTNCDGGKADIFVTKLNADATQVLYTTYLGGSGDDRGFYIDIDSAGNAYVTGETDSINFPTTSNVYQQNWAGLTDGFLAKLSADGSSLEYSTYLGGTGKDKSYALALEDSGRVLIAGYTQSSDFPMAGSSSIQGVKNVGAGADGFLAIIDTSQLSAASLVYSTYLGGNGIDVVQDILVPEDNSAYLLGWTTATDFPTTPPARLGSGGGSDIFVVKLDTTAGTESLDFSVLLGGSGDEEGYGLALDATRKIYIVGDTTSTDIPLQGALQDTFAGITDAYVAVLEPAGDSLAYASYFGGPAEEYGSAIGVDNSGSIYFSGDTAGAIPIINAGQPAHRGGAYDAFIAKMAPGLGSFEMSSYMGGSGDDTITDLIVSDNFGVYVAGSTNSPNFPILQRDQSKAPVFDSSCGYDSACDSGNYDIFVAKFVSESNLDVSISGVGDNSIFGDTITYQYTVSNQGPDIAHNIQLNGSLPADVSNVVIAPPDGMSCTLDGSDFYCSAASLAFQENITVSISLVSDFPGTLQSSVTVSATETDTDQSNNSETVDKPTVGQVYDYTQSGRIDVYLLLGGVLYLVFISLVRRSRKIIDDNPSTDSCKSFLHIYRYLSQRSPFQCAQRIGSIAAQLF